MIPLAGLSLPFMAGLLVDALGWRAIYPPILLAGVLAFIMIRRNIQPLTQRVDFRYLRSFDWVGVALLSGALVSLLFYTSSRPITGVPALQDVRLLLLWPLLFGALIVWERRRPQPVHQPCHLRQQRVQSVVALRRPAHVADDQHQLSAAALHERRARQPGQRHRHRSQPPGRHVVSHLAHAAASSPTAGAVACR